MKKILSLIFIGCLFFSCDSFLEEQSQDQVIPESARDFKEFLFGEAYMGYNNMPDYYLDVMSDDVSEIIKRWGSDYRLDYFGYYTWQQEPELGLGEAVKDDMAWGNYYHKILMANMVLDLIDDAEGTEAEKADVKGEAYYIRANAYFKLVNLYATPYNKETAATTMGVPINDNIGVKDVVYDRASIEEVYKKIDGDIKNSIKYLEEANQYKTVFRISATAANLLAARIALYKGEWDNAIDYANKVILKQPYLCNLNEYSTNTFIHSSNPEMIFTYGNNTTSDIYRGSAKGMMGPSKELYALYASNDLRKDKYFWVYYGEIRPRKGFLTTNDLYGFALRTSEAYLIRAESYAEKGSAADISKAIADINLIRSNRLSKNTGEDGFVDVEVSASTKEETVVLVRTERRMELCFEQQRWFDLRRWGMPSIEHVWTSDLSAGTKERYVLEKNDPAYTLPVPKDVRISNPDIKNISRPDRASQTNE